MATRESESSMEMTKLEDKPDEVYTKTKNRGAFSKPWVFLVVLVIWSILKATAGGYTSGNITSLEKRFQLKSTEIGVLATVEDIIGLTTVMVIVHFGQSQHRPRVVGLLSLVVAFGVLLQGVPHFLYDLPPTLLVKTPTSSLDSNATGSEDSSSICRVGVLGQNEEQMCTEEEKASAGSLMHEAYWLPLGSAVISLGGGIGPISITYLDDNVSKRAMPVYAAVLFSVYAFGSIFGFFLASIFLQLPVTFPTYDPEYYSAQPGDANWLGAWWLGYLVCSFLLAVFGLVFCLFPRQMRDPRELALENAEYIKQNPIPESAKAKEKEHHEDLNSSGVIAFIKDFLRSLMCVFRNAVVLCLILAGCLAAFSATVFMIFGPKFLLVVYELDPSMAALVMGAFLIPGAFVGQIFGGLVIKKLNLNRYGMAVMCVVTDLLLFFGFVFFYLIRCDKRGVAGLTVSYQPDIDYSGMTAYNSSSSPLLMTDGLIGSCNEDCGCPEGIYQPICGTDGITYVTACHAGCGVYDSVTMLFSECKCISDNGMAALGQCERPCSAWLFYILLMIPASFLGTMGAIAGFMLQLRSVDDAHRGLAMSLGNVLVKLLGYIPGPVIIGFVIEFACLMFQQTCGKTGNCVVYDSDMFLNNFNTSMIVTTLISTLFVILACYKVRQNTPKGERGFRIIPDNDDDVEEKA